jgi:hypothetical protein
MFKRSSIAGAATLLALAWSQSSFAQVDCSDIDFSSEIEQRFPRAQEACIDIVEQNGRQYAHFQAEIVDVRGNEVRAKFRAPDGTYSDTITFTPPAEARVRIDNRSYRYSQLSQGQELDVYLPPDRWEIAVHDDPVSDFATAQTVTTVPLSEPEEERVARLPSTASVLPLLACLGLALLSLGAVVAKLGRRT